MYTAPPPVAGGSKRSQVQVEVDRLAAAPRKTLNRNPAEKIACSQSTQGVCSPSLAYDNPTDHLLMAYLAICMSKQVSRAQGPKSAFSFYFLFFLFFSFLFFLKKNPKKRAMTRLVVIKRGGR
jgi:hypothetical protein